LYFLVLEQVRSSSLKLKGAPAKKKKKKDKRKREGDDIGEGGSTSSRSVPLRHGG